jgi:hypothetical protein
MVPRSITQLLSRDAEHATLNTQRLPTNYPQLICALLLNVAHLTDK